MGAYAKQIILPFESQQDFDELKDLFIQDFRPNGVTEFSLVHELTILAWKKLRLEKIENNYLRGLLEAAETAEEFYAAGFPRRDGIDWLLNDLTILTPEFIKLHTDDLALANSLRDPAACNQFLSVAKQKFTLFYLRLNEAFNRWDKDQGTTKLIVRFTDDKSELLGEEPLTAPDINLVLPSIIEESEAIVYVCTQLPRLNAFKNLIRDRRLGFFMENPGSSRAYADLSRAFFKALDELRKQQEWGHQKRIIQLATQTPVLPTAKSRNK